MHTAFLIPSNDPKKIVASLRRRREVIHNLCSALEAYLADEIDEAVTEMEKPQPPPQYVTMNAPPASSWPTVEHLIEAQELVESSAKQMEALRSIAEGMGGKMGQSFIDMQMPMLERLHKDFVERAKFIQDNLEAKESADVHQ